MTMFRGDLDFLSNFYVRAFELPPLGQVVSGEHGFNAFKTTSPEERARVLAAGTPGQAKGQGRRVTLRPGWDAGVRVAAMQYVLSYKFDVPDLAERLLATEHAPLVESNHWHDQFWGDCFCPRHAELPGKNMLGELLMALRASLKAGS